MRHSLPTVVAISALAVVAICGCNPSKQEQAAQSLNRRVDFDPFKDKPRTTGLIERATAEDNQLTSANTTATGSQTSSGSGRDKGSFTTFGFGAGVGETPKGEGYFGLVNVSGADKSFDLNLLDVQNADKDYRDAYQLGEKFLNAQEYDKALAAFDDAQRLNPSNYAAYVGEGFCYFRKADYGKALAAMEFAIRAAPQMAALYAHRGHIYLRTGQNRQALDDFTKVLEAQPDDVGARVVRAQIYGLLDNQTAAIADYDLAIRAAPADPILLLNRAVAYYKSGRHKAAIDDASAALRLNPKLIDGYFLRAVAKLQLKDAAGGRPDFDEAVKLGLDPRVAAGWRPAFHPEPKVGKP